MFKRKNGFHFLGSVVKESNQIISAIVKTYFNSSNYNFVFLFAGQMSVLTSLLKNNLLKNNKIICSEILSLLVFAYSKNNNCEIEFLNEYKCFNDFVTDRRYFNLSLLLEVAKIGDIKDEEKRKVEISKKYNKIVKDNSFLINREKFYEKKLSFLSKVDFVPECSYKLFEKTKNDKNNVFLVFIPYFENGYEKQIEFFTKNVLFPHYCYVDYVKELDKDYSNNVYYFLENSYNAIILGNKKLLKDNIKYNYIANKRNNEIVFVKKDNKIFEENYFFNLDKKREIKLLFKKGIEIITEDDYEKLTLKDKLVSFYISDKTAKNINRIYLKKVDIITSAQFNTLQCIKKEDGRLLAIGIVRLDSRTRSNLFVKTDLSFNNIGTLAKLNACCFLNDEYNNNIIKKTSLVLNLKTEKITTVVFTDKPCSMKYRNIAKCVKKEEVKDASISECKYKLTYSFNKNIWQKKINDIYKLWFNKWKK